MYVLWKYIEWNPNASMKILKGALTRGIVGDTERFVSDPTTCEMSYNLSLKYTLNKRYNIFSKC